MNVVRGGIRLVYDFFIYPIYFRLFRYKAVEHEFNMTWDELPRSSPHVNQLLERPIKLRYQENPNYFLILDASDIPVLQSERPGTLRVLIRIWGDHSKGAIGSLVTKVEGREYWKHQGTSGGADCKQCRSPGPSPLDEVLCEGPCPEAR